MQTPPFPGAACLSVEPGGEGSLTVGMALSQETEPRCSSRGAANVHPENTRECLIHPREGRGQVEQTPGESQPEGPAKASGFWGNRQADLLQVIL